ncbi:MAG: transcriptional regulator [Frondihabitans sp.]|nr:transcriptional regulator [Frondihabitans sp.]
MTVRIHIDRLLVERAMSVGDFADAIGITPANVAVLKNGRARAVRLTTLDAICHVLQCQPGDILSWTDDQRDRDDYRLG